MKKFIKHIFVLSLILGITTNCAKRCPVASCKMILDHQHFFGAENEQTGATLRKDSELPVGYNDQEKKKKSLLGRFFGKKKQQEETASDSTSTDTNTTDLTADANNSGEAAKTKSVGASLPVYSGVKWWRRIFKKKYRTEEKLAYKKFEKIRYSGKNKDQLEKLSTK